MALNRFRVTSSPSATSSSPSSPTTRWRTGASATPSSSCAGVLTRSEQLPLRPARSAAGLRPVLGVGGQLMASTGNRGRRRRCRGPAVEPGQGRFPRTRRASRPEEDTLRLLRRDVGHRRRTRPAAARAVSPPGVPAALPRRHHRRRGLTKSTCPASIPTTCTPHSSSSVGTHRPCAVPDDPLPTSRGPPRWAPSPFTAGPPPTTGPTRPTTTPTSCASTSTRRRKDFHDAGSRPRRRQTGPRRAFRSARLRPSGSRGIHVFIPIRPQWDFIATRRAVIALGREMERRALDRITMSWWKEERGDRVFIDYNQNARDRSMASASLRRRSPTRASRRPVTWDELVDVDPAELTVATVPGLLARRGDPWADVGRLRRDRAAAGDGRPRCGDGLGDPPYPPSFPKMPGSRRASSPAVWCPEHWGLDPR